MIKYFSDKILAIILRIFNSFLETGQIIEDLCEGLIGPIFKENDKSNPDNYTPLLSLGYLWRIKNNYRGICISNALLKCLCLILNNRLKKFSSKNNLIAREQIGFREKNRTTDHIFTLKLL